MSPFFSLLFLVLSCNSLLFLSAHSLYKMLFRQTSSLVKSRRKCVCIFSHVAIHYNLLIWICYPAKYNYYPFAFIRGLNDWLAGWRAGWLAMWHGWHSSWGLAGVWQGSSPSPPTSPTPIPDLSPSGSQWRGGRCRVHRLFTKHW